MSSKRAVASNPSETGEFSSGPRPFRSQAVAEDPSGVTGGPAPWRFNYPQGDLAERFLGRGRERGYRRSEQTANTAGTDANHPRGTGPGMAANIPADQTLRLINTELTGLTERFHRQVTHEGEGNEEDGLAEGTEEMRMRKRTRTRP